MCLYLFNSNYTDKPVQDIIKLKCVNLLTACSNGNILAIDHNEHSMTVLYKEGMSTKKREIEKKKLFKYPNGLAVTEDDEYVLVTDEHRLQKLTLNGVCVKSIDSKSGGHGQLNFNHPSGIAVHPITGQIFVADEGNNRVQVLNADFTFSHIIIPDDKHFRAPCGISLDREGYLYVAEHHNHCITKLTTTGKYITRFGSMGSARGQLSFPTSLTIHNDLVYVSEFGNHRVSVFDTEGQFIRCIGKQEENLQYPCSVAVDALENIYISDQGNNSIFVY